MNNFIFFTTIKENIPVLNQQGIDVQQIKINKYTALKDKFKKFVCKYIVSKQCFKTTAFDLILKPFDIDLIFFMSPNNLATRTKEYNYIFRVWDLNHRDMSEFPEVRKDGVFESRECLYRSTLTKAIKIFTDCEQGKKWIEYRYGIDSNRVDVLPYLVSNSVKISQADYEKNYLDIKAKYELADNYIYYPAQFWSHKNHVYILKGLKFLKEKHNKKIHALFSGSDKGNLAFVLAKAEELGVKDQVHYLGFVDNEEIPYLYKQSLALVMPTYLGPTNIPPLEAFALEVPVLYSNKAELWPFVEKAALPLDLLDPTSMAENLLKVINNDPEVKQIVTEGAKKLAGWTDEHFWQKLQAILDEYREVMTTWK